MQNVHETSLMFDQHPPHTFGKMVEKQIRSQSLTSGLNKWSLQNMKKQGPWKPKTCHLKKLSSRSLSNWCDANAIKSLSSWYNANASKDPQPMRADIINEWCQITRVGAPLIKQLSWNLEIMLTLSCVFCLQTWLPSEEV